MSNCSKVTFTRREAAEALGVGLTKLDELLRRTVNPLPSIRLGRKILIPCAAFEAWLAGMTAEGSGAEE